jgi:hypothetical protein
MDETCRGGEEQKPALSLCELAAQITELAGHLNAANYRWLSLIAEFDRRQGWSDGSTQSCAHWLNWKVGLALGAAREKVRVAHALEKLPRIAAAMARGELSYSKARALTRVVCEKTEEYFLSIALHGAACHVEKLVRCYRRAQEAEELSREARQQATRGVSYFHDDDGSLVLKARLPAEVGALLIKALDAAVEDPPVREVSAGTSVEPAACGLIVTAAEDKPSWGARRADALGRIAESFLQHGAEVLSGGDRQQIVVHVDAQTLHEGCAGRCELEDGPSLAAETVRRLACDASIVTIVENEQGEPLNVGRKRRSIPPAIRRALNARDRGCRFPGCSRTRYLDAHHVQHWAQGGETKLSNLTQLCRFHHRQVHEGRVVVQVLDDGDRAASEETPSGGALRFLRPDGRRFDSVAADHTRPLGDWQQLPAVHEQQGLHISKDTATTRWRGERMDYGLGIEVLLQHAKRASRVSEETH